MQKVLKKLWIQDFRLHKDLLLDLDFDSVMFLGANGSGKTTIIEAISLIGHGKSFRANKIEEMIGFSAQIARIKAVVSEANNASTQELQITLTRGVFDGTVIPKTQYWLNQVKKQKKMVVGSFYPVIFRPEDMRLIEGSPARRRAFIDTLLCSVEKDYAFYLKQYENVLVRRNKLLLLIREKAQSESSLKYWDEKLLEAGEFIQKKRKKFFEKIKEVSFAVNFVPEYRPKLLTQERLKEYQARSILAGHTLIGPHKDDFAVLLDLSQFSRHTAIDSAQDIAIFGSRGQQRLAVLWLKLCELFCVQETNKPAVVVLDDVFSELDEKSRQIVSQICQQNQTIITSANDLDLDFEPKKITRLD